MPQIYQTNPLLGSGARPPLTSGSFNTNLSENEAQNTAASQSQQQATSRSSSSSFIPQYSQTPILERIAQTAEGMAPQSYNWGMNQFNKNQGNIDSLMNDANRYEGQPQQAVDMGAAEAAVTSAGAQGLQNSIRDLQDFGIDPSSGRYAGLDRAAQVQNAAAAAGAGNMQRNADMARANTERDQAISAGLQNSAFGNQVGQTANAFLGTAMRLPYSPLGTQSQSASDSSGNSTSNSQGTSDGFTLGYGESGSSGGGGGGGSGSGGGGTKGPQQQKPEQPPPNPPASPEENATGTMHMPVTNPSKDPPPLGGDRPTGPTNNFPGDPNWEPAGSNPDGNQDLSPFGNGTAPLDFGGQSPYGAFDPGSGVGLDGGGNYSGDVSAAGFGGGGGGGEYHGGPIGYADGGGVDPDQEQGAGGGYDPEADGPAVPTGRSPTQGQAIDDVPSKLTVGEFVMPNDVVKWKGEEYFQKLISQSREARQSIMAVHGQLRGGRNNLGGAI